MRGGTSGTAGMLDPGVEVRIRIVVPDVEGIAGVIGSPHREQRAKPLATNARASARACL